MYSGEPKSGVPWLVSIHMVEGIPTVKNPTKVMINAIIIHKVTYVKAKYLFSPSLLNIGSFNSKQLQEGRETTYGRQSRSPGPPTMFLFQNCLFLL
jgi:hypothetical protein